VTGRWTALAEELADSIREPGFGAAACVAAAWSARVDPMATRSLVTAAVALAGTDAVPALWEPLPPCPDAATLLEWGENLESHVGDLLKRCVDTGMAARAERDAAVRAQREAALADAARDRRQDAALVAADCEVALDLLALTDGRLRYALDCVRALPADLDEAYEAAGRIVAAGGALPHSGDFIAPSGTPEMIRQGSVR
jgi:hypothetical protein